VYATPLTEPGPQGVVPEKLSKLLFFKSKMDGIGGTLCRDVLDDGPEPCNFGLAMETSAREVNTTALPCIRTIGLSPFV